ncbi:CU044_5270 family protein [Nonomuraea sp. NPDC048916]|uniref:CU044_5270 family protein n=1 Tax=Nonomuraea sp. NPDC048916 TaxID=3154232 RepID=UPI00340D16C4
MDDLSAVRQQCAVPGPSAETVARGRARLWALVEEERASTAPSSSQVDGRRAQPRSAGRSAQGKWWPAFGLGLTGAVAAITLLLPQAAQPPTPPSTRPNPQQILLAAATSVAKQPADGDWWGIKLIKGLRISEPRGRYELQVTAAEETWIQVAEQDDSHWTVRRYHGARPATPQDEQAWQADGSPTTWSYQDGGAGRAPLLGADPERLAAAPGTARSDESADVNWRLMLAGKPLTRMDDLPEDPERLRALLEPPAGDTTDLLNNLATLIVHVPVSPKVRAAAYQLMASLPAVTAQGQVTDQLGRTGQAVVYPRPDHQRSGREVRTRLIVDPTTGAPLALETLTPDSLEIVEFTAVESTVWTDRKPDLPNPHPLDEKTQ